MTIFLEEKDRPKLWLALFAATFSYQVIQPFVLHLQWSQLRSRKQNLIRLFERMQNYQFEVNSDPEKILETNVRTLTEEDIDR